MKHALNSLELLMIQERNVTKKIQTVEETLMVEEETLEIVDIDK